MILYCGFRLHETAVIPRAETQMLLTPATCFWPQYPKQRTSPEWNKIKTKPARINRQSPNGILCFSKQKLTFPVAETYGFHEGNVRFRHGKHKNLLYIFPFAPLRFTYIESVPFTVFHQT